MPGNVRPVVDEADALLAYLRQQRDVVCNAAFGLDDEQAGLMPTVSALSIGGIIKHLAMTERYWIDLAANRYQPPSPDEGFTAYREGMIMGSGDSITELIADYRRCGDETDKAIATIPDIGSEVPIPDAPWFPKDVKTWSVRWILLHLIEETARHAGHADIIRESIDGAQAFPLMAAAEGWPETPWVRPWKREG